MSKYVYGIDLGTTYSCIAYQDETGRPVVVQNREGTNTTPSVVQFIEDSNEVIVGQIAKDTSVLYAKNTISLIKTKMGRETKVYYGANADKEITPVEVSACILRKICKDAGELLDDQVKDVVITCPAYFGEAERMATKQAGIVAGLNVISILDEPTAAAIYYGCSKESEKKNVLVYDLGGGTFDVTVMNIDGGDINVICTDGNHDLGGKDWDAVIMRYVAEQFEQQSGYSGDYDDEAKQDLAIKVERAKIQLSSRDRTTIMLHIQGYKAAVELTRDKFDELTKPLLDTSMDLTDQVMFTAKEYGYGHIDEFLLVGGSTKMPQVPRAIEERLHLQPKIMEPDEAVAKGAAIYAIVKCMADARSFHEESSDNINTEKEVVDYLPSVSIEPKRSQRVVIHTKTSKSFGIKAMRDGNLIISNLILKNTSTPCTVKKVFGIAEDDQEYANIEVYESSVLKGSYPVEESYKVGNAILELPRNLRMGSGVEITMELTNEGTLKLTGRELSSNREIQASFQSECILTEEKVMELKRKMMYLTIE